MADISQIQKAASDVMERKAGDRERKSMTILEVANLSFSKRVTPQRP